MPLLIWPALAGIGGWIAGLWTSDGFSKLFWFAVLLVVALVLWRLF